MGLRNGPKTLMQYPCPLLGQKIKPTCQLLPHGGKQTREGLSPFLPDQNSLATQAAARRPGARQATTRTYWPREAWLHPEARDREARAKDSLSGLIMGGPPKAHGTSILYTS